MGREKKENCLEGESNSHLRIAQAVLGHFDDRYETFVLAVILSRLVIGQYSDLNNHIFRTNCDGSAHVKILGLYDHGNSEMELSS